MLRSALDAVVVVVERHSRIGLSREPERLREEVGADDLQPLRLAQVLADAGSPPSLIASLTTSQPEILPL